MLCLGPQVVALLLMKPIYQMEYILLVLKYQLVPRQIRVCIDHVALAKQGYNIFGSVRLTVCPSKNVGHIQSTNAHDPFH